MKWNRLHHENGSMVVEAALILPLFLLFVLAMIAFIQMSMIDNALQSDVTETAKQVSAHMYAVELMYDQFNSSKTGQTINEFIEKFLAARQHVEDAEQTAQQYSDIIPEPMLAVLRWEQIAREHAEQQVEDGFDQLLDHAFLPLLRKYADDSILDTKGNRLHVIHVKLPDLKNKQDVFFGIEAQYDYILPLPFFHKVIHLKKQAYERSWIGYSQGG